MNSFRALSFLSVSLSLALGTEAQQVFIVDDDGGPGVDFLTVGEALAASEEGATIHVRPGAYEEFLGIDFSVSILVRPGATVDGSIWVHDLGPNQSVYLRGIDMANIGPLSEVLIAEGNLGSLIVESCRFRGSPVSFHSGPDTVILRDCARVVMDRCRVRGGTHVFAGSEGRAVVSVRSNLTLLSSRLTGGQGLAGNPAETGGAALTLVDGTLFGFDARLIGGRGGSGGNFFFCADAANGGPGLALTGTDPRAHLIGCFLLGGEGGVPLGTGSCLFGEPGPTHLVEAGTLRDRPFPGLVRR